jgi:hypothetical protein
VLVPSVVPPLFGLSAELQFPLSVVCVAFEPCPVVVVQVPVSNSLPWDGLTAPAGDVAARTPRVLNARVTIANFFFIRSPASTFFIETALSIYLQSDEYLTARNLKR